MASPPRHQELLPTEFAALKGRHDLGHVPRHPGNQRHTPAPEDPCQLSRSSPADQDVDTECQDGSGALGDSTRCQRNFHPPLALAARVEQQEPRRRVQHR